MSNLSMTKMGEQLNDIWHMNTNVGKKVENPIKNSVTNELETVFNNLKRWE